MIFKIRQDYRKIQWKIEKDRLTDCKIIVKYKIYKDLRSNFDI